MRAGAGWHGLRERSEPGGDEAHGLMPATGLGSEGGKDTASGLVVAVVTLAVRCSDDEISESIEPKGSVERAVVES